MRHFLGLVRRALRLALARADVEVIYTYRPEAGRPPEEDAHVEVYDAATPPPPKRRRELIAVEGRAAWLLQGRRLARRGARLLCYVEKDELLALGWIQPGLSRRYRWLLPRAIILGPYWTAPAHRGHGLYGRLLAHSVAVTPPEGRHRLLICARPDNVASRRGIIKAGFQELGTFRIFAMLGDRYSWGRPVQADACEEA